MTHRRRLFSLVAIGSMAMAISNTVAADSYINGYLCSVSDLGSTIELTVSSDRFCNGTWVDTVYVLSSFPNFSVQLDRLQSALYEQAAVAMGVSGGQAAYFAYQPEWGRRVVSYPPPSSGVGAPSSF